MNNQLRIVLFLFLVIVLLNNCSLLEANNDKSLLTLDACLQLARERNPALEIACLRTKQAVETKNEVRSALLPYISIEGVWDNRNDSLSGDLTQFQDFNSTKALGLSVKQSLFDFGASWVRLKASRLRISAAQLDQEGVVLGVEEQVKASYFQVLSQEKVVEVVASGIITLEGQLAKSKDLYNEGVVKHSDVLAVGVQLSEKKQRLLQEKNTLATHRMALNRLIGLPLFEAPHLKDIDGQEAICLSFERAFEYALSNRRDYLALCKQIEALQSDYRASNLSHLPHFYAFGNGNYSSNRSTVSAGIGMNLPLYEGGRKRAQNNKILSELRALRATQADLENGMAIEIQNARLQLEEIQESIALSKEAIALAKETLQNYRELYSEGQVSISDILLAEDSLTQVRTGFVRNLYRYQMTLAHLNTITGGFL